VHDRPGERGARVGEKSMVKGAQVWASRKVSREPGPRRNLERGVARVLEAVAARVESLKRGGGGGARGGRIQAYEARMAKIARERHPSRALKQVKGGRDPDRADVLVLDLEDPPSVPKESATVVFSWGLRLGAGTPERASRRCTISKKQGGKETLFEDHAVKGRHYILGTLGQDSDLRRWD